MAEQSRTTTREESAVTLHTSPGARFAAGIVAGLVGGILMIGFMIGYAQATGAGLTTPLKALGGFVYGVEALVVGPEAILAGTLIQLGFAIVVGILFALFVSRSTSTLAAMCSAIVVAVVIWVAMDLLVLPYENPTMAARITFVPIAYFIAHLLLGLGLGMTPAFIRAFSRERRHDKEIRDRAHPGAAQTQSI